jgi:predicted CXXCH cytochrome family protein
VTALLRMALLSLGCALAVGYAILWLTETTALGQEGTPPPAAAETVQATQTSTDTTASQVGVTGAGSPDQACRLCHVDSTAVMTLPSGETLEARVDLTELQNSVHGQHAAAAVYCTDCHQPRVRYQFPHEPNPAETLHDFSREIAGNCESCHMSAELHNPGHMDSLRAGADPATLPACTDCHGGHDVEPSEVLETDTTTFCQSCHAIEDFEEPQVKFAHEQAVASFAATNGNDDPSDDRSCLTCHSDQPQSVSQQCVNCHSMMDATVQRGEDEIPLNVNTHEILTSVHGERIIDGQPYPSLQCADCHRDMAEAGFPHPDELLVDREQLRTNVESSCMDCHQGAADKSADGIHATRIAEGELNAASCADCHGSHNIQIPDQPRNRVSETCGTCHEEVYTAFEASVHASTRYGRLSPDAPVCTDCHGAHDIPDPTTAAWRNSSPQMCGDCHADKEMMSKYDISTNVFDTYVADFHGTTTTLFVHDNPNEPVNTAVCYDCHGVHDVQPLSEATEEQIQERLLATCRECHPDASENFPASWMSHYEPSLENYPAVYLVDLFYKIFIPTILGGFLLFIGSDIFRRVSDRYVARRARKRDDSGSD